MVIVFGVLVFALFLTGALLSIRKEANAPVRTIHWILTVLAVISGGLVYVISL